MQEANKIHQCQCSVCRQPEEHPNQIVHHQMNMFLSRLNEQKRRWFVAIESKTRGYGGDSQMSEITGMNVETIRRGHRELDEDLAGRPEDRVRLPGAGRPPLKKTIQTSLPT